MEDGSVNINAKDSKDGKNALLKLTRNYGYDNLIELVQPLIKRGVDVNAKDPNGWNALHNLCRYYKHNNLIGLIRILEKSNIDIEAKTKEGYSAHYLWTYLNPTTFNSEDITKILYKGNDFSKVEQVKYYNLVMLKK